MSADCQFPGCENGASATYCEACRLRTLRSSPPPPDPLYFVPVIVATAVAIAAVVIFVLLHGGVI